MKVETRAFDHSGGNPLMAGDRGVVVEAETGFSGMAFSSRLPDAFLTESGEVEFADCRVPLATFQAWAGAVIAASPALFVSARRERLGT